MTDALASRRSAHTLVAGVGNVFLGDDGFGPAVVRALAQDGPPEGVHVEDYGVRSVHLAFDLVDGPGRLIVVDAIGLDEPPGSLVLARPGELPGKTALDGHGMSIEQVLDRATSMGAVLDDVLLLACVPASVAPGMALSPAVEEAVPVAIDRLHSLLLTAAQP